MDKVWCICRKCSSQVLGVPGSNCPGCEKGILEKDWPEHVSIEDEYLNGRHVIVVRRAREPISGHYCTLCRKAE